MIELGGSLDVSMSGCPWRPVNERSYLELVAGRLRVRATALNELVQARLCTAIEAGGRAATAAKQAGESEMAASGAMCLAHEAAWPTEHEDRMGLAASWVAAHCAEARLRWHECATRAACEPALTAASAWQARLEMSLLAHEMGAKDYGTESYAALEAAWRDANARAVA
jgi:hypothetical protein